MSAARRVARTSVDELAALLNAGARIECANMETVTAILLAAGDGPGEVVSLAVLHDDGCSPIACRCVPTFALERGVDRVVALARKAAEWARQSVN